jgi:hypothetical protein
MPSTRTFSTVMIVCFTFVLFTATVTAIDSPPQVETSGGDAEAATQVQVQHVELDPRVAFMAPIELTPADPASVRTVGGVEISGTIATIISGRHGLTSITLRPADGKRQKFRAADIDELVVEPGTIARLSMVMSATSTLRKVARNDLRSTLDHDVVVFHNVAWPKASDARLLQLVNPGFASRVRVYHLISAMSATWTIAGVPVAGDESKAFAVIKDGGEPMRVSGRHYEQRDFDLLFGDCPEMLQLEISSDRSFHRFAQHAFLYDRLCGRENDQ